MALYLFFIGSTVYLAVDFQRSMFADVAAALLSQGNVLFRLKY